jgi:2-polyprenyl-6-hydroxyphenyl methylase/3-demethylubiquinone-9 3-methyltransferase
MGVGAKVRRLFGPLEGPVTDLYRSFFVDLGRQARQVGRWVAGASDILEIGCGEGALCQRLVRVFPTARLTGIDITPRVGRLFRGNQGRVRFAQATAAEFTSRQPAGFDLILMCDVLHHVPWDQHPSLLADAGQMLRPGGTLVVKDWELIPNVGHALCEWSDRVLTGDDVRYGSADYFCRLFEGVYGLGSVQARARIPPWRNNLMFLVRPTPPGAAS